MKEIGNIGEVYFDSGGYYVQTGKITYEDMYWRLLNFYRENQWADHFVLPDYVPLSSDSVDDVWHKVHRTADLSSLFFQEMPSNLQGRALPVVQGHTIEQIEYCIQRYLNLGVKNVGFGSFDTNGKSGSSNTLSVNALNFLAHLVKILLNYRINLHAFGVGTPPVIYLLHKIGVHSFDSVGWMKTAGYGKIYMPFVRAYNVTYRDPLARGLTQTEFYRLKELTEHDCIFCQSFDKLATHRPTRVMHNLAVILDTIDLLKKDTAHVPDMLLKYSPFYAKLYAEVSI
jgi:queuine/archaeosine tRNA-ribosyltransferase